MNNQLNNIPTEAENKELKKLFLAIYFNDLEKVIEFKNKFPEIYAKRDKFLIEIDETFEVFDLINLTFFNQVIWFEADWIDEIKPLVEKHRQRTNQMLDFWRAELGQQEIHRKIEYNQYYCFFACGDPNDFEEIILDTKSTYLKKGFREIDLNLYNRADCFDFVEVKKLLEQGAKCDVNFEEEDDDGCCTIGRISDECCYLSTCEVIPEFEEFEINGYNKDFNTTKMFRHLLGLAAHEEMYNLLDKYYEEE